MCIRDRRCNTRPASAHTRENLNRIRNGQHPSHKRGNAQISPYRGFAVEGVVGKGRHTERQRRVERDMGGTDYPSRGRNCCRVLRIAAPSENQSKRRWT
eukprot:3042353-Pyramimonas_sp.AAC.1